MALSTFADAGVKTQKRKAGLFMVEAVWIELDELRVDTLVLRMAGETEFILVLVESSGVPNAARHFGMAGQAPFVVDFTVERVTRLAAVGTRKLSMESRQWAGSLSLVGVLEPSTRDEYQAQHYATLDFQHSCFREYEDDAFDAYCPNKENPRLKISFFRYRCIRSLAIIARAISNSVRISTQIHQ